MQSPSASVISILPALLLMACGPSQDEVNALLAEQEKQLTQSFRQTLVKQGLMPSRAEREAENRRERDKEEWQRSMDFLAKLDSLMSSYSPDLPSLEDDGMLRCTTDYEFGLDRELTSTKGLQSKAAKELERKTLKTERLLDEKWNQYRIDALWAERRQIVEIYGCWDGRQWAMGVDSEDACCCLWSETDGFTECSQCRRGRYAWAHKEMGPGKNFLYSGTTEAGKPELMRRIKENGVALPKRFHCKVEQIEQGKETVTVYCEGDEPKGTRVLVSGSSDVDSEGFQEQLIHGVDDISRQRLKALHRGDIISVPIEDVRRDPGGVLTKEEHEVDGTAQMVWVLNENVRSVDVEEKATCPTRDEILLAESEERQ
jgi:hypothetical protein